MEDFKDISTPRLKETISRAIEIKDEKLHSYLGQEHVLLAMIESEGIAGDIFRKLNITRSDIEKILSELGR